MPARDAVTWNVLLGCLVRRTRPAAAAEAFCGMAAAGFVPTAATLCTMLKVRPGCLRAAPVRLALGPPGFLRLPGSSWRFLASAAPGFPSLQHGPVPQATPPRLRFHARPLPGSPAVSTPCPLAARFAWTEWRS